MTNITRTTCAVVVTLVLSVLSAVAQGTVTATVAVQAPIYLAGRAADDADPYVTALGLAKVGMGWPLQLAALAVMVWLLARNRTPVEPSAGGAAAVSDRG